MTAARQPRRRRRRTPNQLAVLALKNRLLPECLGATASPSMPATWHRTRVSSVYRKVRTCGQPISAASHYRRRRAGPGNRHRERLHRQRRPPGARADRQSEKPNIFLVIRSSCRIGVGFFQACQLPGTLRTSVNPSVCRRLAARLAR